MRAIRIHGYGGPQVQQVEERPIPVAGAGERLVRVQAAGVNPIDRKMREGWLKAVFPPQLPCILGRDGAGVELSRSGHARSKIVLTMD